MFQKIKSWIVHPHARKLLDHPWIFSGFRFFIVGLQGGTKRRLRALLDMHKPSKVLDVCCGVGDFAGLVDAQYYGIDLNPRFITLAKNRYRRIAQKTFEIEDATRMRYPSRSFDVTLFINATHHFPTELVKGILREISRVTKERVVILDMDPTQGQWWQRAVMACDRGDYGRPIAEQRLLIEEFLIIERAEVYVVGCIVQTLFVCRPRV